MSALLAEQLLEKYVQMRTMRLDDARAAADEASLRVTMRELASRFPGALREIDELPMSEIDRRVSVLRAAVAGEIEAPAWALWMGHYHGWLRAALAIKRCAAKRSPAEVWGELPSWYEEQPGSPALAELTVETVQQILRPPGGRLNPWVFQRVADRFSVTASQVEEALFAVRSGSTFRSEH